MTAGESARVEARRAREKAERLTRRAEMFERGADGESRTADTLRSLGSKWVILHDQRWPGRRLANIDHIVIGPGGIFVIDSKNWSGDLRVDGQTLRQNGRSREPAVAGAADAALAVAELVAPFAFAVRPALCFTREEDVTGWVRDVMVCSTSTLASMLVSRERILDSVQVSEAASRLDAQMRAATGPVPARSAATPKAGTRRAASSGSVSVSGRTSTRRRPTRRRKQPSFGRLIAFVLAAALFYFAMPTVLPAVGNAVSNVIVGQLDDKPTCKTDARRLAEGQSASKAGNCDRG
jgi:hypothetical protein